VINAHLVKGMVRSVFKILLFAALFYFSITRSYAVLKADFTISGAIGCSPVVASFTNTSTGAVSYLWLFGNGNTSTSVNPGAIYTNPGNYTITLVAKDGSGNVDSVTKSNAITVYQNPTAGFKTNVVSGCASLFVSFTDTTTAGSGAITSWSWDFGDGAVSSVQNPTHTYINPGTYTISLVVSNALGCKSTLIRSSFITVVQKPGVSMFANRNYFCDSIATVQFTDNSTNEIAGKTTWLWRFGDGATSALKNPTHTYTHFGSYKVTLVVNISSGCIDSFSSVSFINLTKYSYDFKADVTSGCGLFKIKFTNLTNPQFPWISYSWDFGDGTTSNLVNPSHIYLDSGKYSVRLIATGINSGCADTVFKKNYISEGIRPTAKFSSLDSISCSVPKTITFKNLSSNTAVSWLWDFGDGGTSTAKNPVHTYTTFGLYTVKLISKTAEGCADTLSVNDMIQLVQPKAIINSPQPRGCKGKNTVLFFDKSTSLDSIKSWTWYFGDGDTSHSQNPFHSYADTGKYTVTLVITTKDSCKDSLSIPQFVKIGLKPTASFTGSPLDSCIQDMLVRFKEFSDTFKVKPDQYNWDFGDGRISTDKNPTNFYNDPPMKYNVRLIVTANGCPDTLIRLNYITVHGPKAIFRYFQQKCNPDSIYFTNTTLGGNKYIWDFGDSTHSTLKNPAHLYSAPGTYRIVLHAFDTIKGCYNDTNDVVTIPDFSKYKAGFQTDITSGCFPVNVNFTDTSFDAIKESWDFGNGTFSTSKQETVAYTEPGLYTVKLTVTNSKGCTYTTIRPNYIKAFGTVPSFDICKAEECGAGSVKFTDFTRSPDPVSKRVWTFGDGNTLTTTDSIVNHAYTSILPNQLVGYTVRLTVTDSAGCTAFKEDRIRQTKPFQLITKTFSVSCGSYFYNFYPTNTISTGVTPFVFKWQWENEVPVVQSSYSRNITVSGKYHIKLIYTDYYGCTDSAKDSIVVNIKTPNAGFQQSDTFSSCPPLQVQFTDTTVLGNTAIKTWAWDFGDGTKSAFQNPIKLFVLPGRYNVQLTITDVAGCVRSVSKTALIHIKGPTGTYSFTPSEGCDSAVVTFKASTSNASKMQWDLSDGTIVKDSNFTHTFFPKNLVTNGIYLPKLILSDSLGCTYAAPPFDTIRVYPAESIKPSVSDSFPCDTGLVKFADSTRYTNPPKSWFWSFGDGGTSTLRNPVHNYATYDTFTVKLVVSDSTGCTDSIIKKKWIAVSRQIMPAFGTSAVGQCVSQPVTFFDSSVYHKFPAKSWFWNFGDGDTSSAAKPVHTYSSGGVFKVVMQVTNTHGCPDSTSINLTIKTRPLAKFTVNSNCAGDSTIFIDSTVSTAGTIVSRILYFGDGDSATTTGPKHLYKKFGTYQAKLVVTSSFGCVDSVKHMLHIYQKPRAGFTTAPVCVYDTMVFEDTTRIDSGTVVSWKWDFGDGSGSVLQSPAHHYLSAGTYSVALVAYSDHGCIDSTRKTVTVYPKPKASFTVSNDCRVDSIRFTDKSSVASGSVSSWNWDFGDGSSASVIQNPAHLYSVSGTYNVKLSVQTNHGCVDTVSVPVIAYPIPIAGFKKSDICFGNPVSFTDTSSISSGSITKWIWVFGDGDSSTLQNPVHAYPKPGTFKIKHIAISQFGCKDSATDSVVIFPKPKAAFNATTACFSDTTKFTDSSSISTGNIISWNWDFGDGQTSNIQNPVHLYGASGSFSVKLIINSDKGCGDTVTKNVNVFPRPKAAFSFNNSCKRDSVLFTNKSLLSTGAIADFKWDFGDGTTSKQKSPYHLFTPEGKYKITLIVFSDKSCSDTAIDSISIYPMPKAGFSSANVCPYDSMFFNNSTSINSGKVSYSWDFGDGGSSTAIFPRHKYATDGNYTIQLIAVSDHGCSDTFRSTYTVYPMPKSSFVFSNACKTDSVRYLDKSTVKSGTVTDWNWDFGDGAGSSVQNPAHLFTPAGTYTTRLIVTTGKGCVDTSSKNVTIYPMPKAMFTFSNVCFGNSASFQDISSVSSGSLQSWSWDFGDGTKSAVQNPVQFFKNAGSYNVKLVITTALGCKDSITRNIIINPKPKASFSATTVCFKNPTQFTDSSVVSSGKIVAWTWDFGDGNNSALQNPEHIYAAGTYSVILIVHTDSGCSDTFSSKITVYPKPKSLFKVNDVCQVDTAFFSNLSAVSGGSIGQYLWDFGDGAVSTLINPKHKFSAPGTFLVTLYATTDKGCIDTSKQNLVIHPMPIAKFGSAFQCQGLPVTFLDSSSVLTGKISGWKWYFGDGGISTDSLPVHIYSKTDTYTVKLTVRTVFGCGDSTTRKQVIWPLPVTDFKVTNTCVYDSFRFTDLSKIGSGTITQWNWDFADGTTSNAQNPRHLFSTDGTFNVRFVTTSSFGCTDTIFHKVIVFPKPDVHWGADPVCFKYDTHFLDSTSIHSGSIISQMWTFGDGSTSTLLNPVHHYSKPDTFTVKLVKLSDSGCRDSLSHIVIVHPLPVSKWTHSTVCERDSTFFTDKSTVRSGAVTAWRWEFGDGQFSARQNPGHVYPGPGTYKARLIAYSAYGCTDTSKTQDIIVFPRSVPGFKVQPVCFKDTSFFVNNTTILIGGRVVKYLWNFGDSGTNVLANPKHYYRYPNSFNVRLVTTTDKGCSDTISQKAIVYHWPDPEFGPASLCFGDSIQFNNYSKSIDGKIVRYHWDFADPDTAAPGKDTSAAFEPKHYYKKKGYYNVKLTAYTDVGCTNTITHRIHILRLIPQFYAADTLTCLNRPIVFKDYSFSDTGIVKWFWDFGDGAGSFLQNPYYAYKKSGHFTVTLSVEDASGCVRTIIKKQYIEILDTVPPERQPIFRATVIDDATVNVNFRKYTKYDFGSYVLERDMGGGNFAPVFTSSNAGDTSFSDVGLNTLKNTYTYKLIVRDLCGYAFPVDSSTAHTTMNVKGAKGINKSILDWTPYIGWNLVKKYIVYRQNQYNPLKWDSVGSVPGDSLHFEDTSIICYQTHHYKIKAVESDGFFQESYSDTTAVTPVYIPNVIRNNIVRATVAPDNTVLVEWTPSKTRRPWNYILQRSIDDKNFKQVGFYDRTTFHAYDKNVSVNDSSYIYRMLVRDSCGDLSPYTNIAKTILLKTDTALTSGHPALYWTTYKDWPLGVDYYEIQWFDNAAKTWKTVGKVPAVDTQFVDMASNAKQAFYCYRIIGFSRENDSILSISNTACVPTIMHVYVPNAFTPNIDTRNETFNAKGVFIFDYTLKIYNRWGELVFQTDDLNKGWDGTFLGAEAPEGVYIYWIYAAGSNSQVYTKPGNITLIR
jgi:gliding motility-associated-like protein